ncbi:MAG: carotenoid oxygenase family protein, partial [Myxococcota bacterium]
EEGDTIVMTGCRVENPMPSGESWDGTIPRLYFLELQPFMHRWTFNLKTGAVHEERLDDVPTEFPRMNDDLLGQRSRYSYNPRIAPMETLLFDGLIKYDTDTGTTKHLSYGDDRFGSEAVFVPRPGASHEDDGWIVTLVHDMDQDSSECVIYSAQDFTDEPLARILLPRRVPAGFHACWVDERATQV